MTLPYAFYRCVGQILPRQDDETPPVPHRNCNDCRRREPGHPDRQIYLVPILDIWTGECPHRIEPEPC